MTRDTNVLFNGQCPICATEIRHYARYAESRDLPLRFEDLNAVDLARWGVTTEAAAKRLHVLHEGEILSGIPAFIVLWRQMPRYRWLARCVGLPGVRHLAVLVYDLVLAPALYGLHKRRERRALRS